jgi:hypothetical protein
LGVVAGIAVPVRGAAQERDAAVAGAAERTRLTGRVVDADRGLPVASADVFLLPAGRGEVPRGADLPAERLSAAVARTETDARGRYAFGDAPAGRHWIHVRRLGYRPVTVEVRTGGGTSFQVSVAMEVDAIALEPVEVTARAEMELRDGSGTRIAAGRIGAARIRQERFLSSDTRLVTPADVRESVSLGEADVFRSIQRLPGVTTRDDFSAELWTRGASWGETRVYLDGMPLFNPLHGFGLLSGMSARSVGAAVFHPGVRPLSFPEGGAAVLDLHSRSGVGLPETDVGLDLSLASAQAWGGGSLGGPGDAWALTARRSYADVAASLLDGSRDAQLPYAFTDLQGRMDLDLGEGWLLDASALWERDDVTGEIPDVLHDTKASWGNVLGRVALTVPVGRLRLRQTLGGTRYRARVRSFQGTQDSLYNAPSADPALHTVRYLTFRSEVTPEEGGDTLWSAGLDLTDQAVRYDGPEAWPYSRRPPELGDTRWQEGLTRLGLWGRRRWRVGDLSAEGGVRMDVGDPIRERRAELSATGLLRYRVSPDLMLSAGAGRWAQYAQSPAAVGPRVERSLESGRLWVLAGPHRSALRVRMATLGGEAWLGDAWLASATAYLRRSTGVQLPDPTPGLLIQRRALVEGEVTARGLDVSLRRLAGRVRGWIGYSYGHAQARAADRTVPAPTDRTHTLDLAASVDLGPSWDLGTAYSWASGAPYVRVVDDCDRDGCGPGVLLDRPFQRRAPGYQSLDVVLTWKHRFEGWTLGAFLQGRNLLGHDNAITYTGTAVACNGSPLVGPDMCGDGTPAQVRDEFQTGIPTLPLLGFTVVF